VSYRYVLEVVELDGRCVARLGADAGAVDSPLRGEGETPLEAVRALCATLTEWPITGARQWLATPDGRALVARFVDDPLAPNRGRRREERPS
jgi:hypothetical protein